MYVLAPLVTTTAFILKGLSGRLSEPPANRFPQNCRQKFPIFEFIKFKFIHGIKLQGWLFVFPNVVTTRQQANYDRWL